MVVQYAVKISLRISPPLFEVAGDISFYPYQKPSNKKDPKAINHIRLISLQPLYDQPVSVSGLDVHEDKQFQKQRENRKTNDGYDNVHKPGLRVRIEHDEPRNKHGNFQSKDKK